MSAELLIANLLRVAKEDLEGARLLAAAGNRNAVYLCEQAAEKLMRAVLTAEGKHAGVKHQLDAMVDLIADENPLKPALRQVEDLAAYATSYRYPTSVGRIQQAPPPATLTASMAKVETAINQAAALFGVDLTKLGSPAAHARPVR
jgi:HEPN domain-containing protein